MLATYAKCPSAKQAANICLHLYCHSASKQQTRHTMASNTQQITHTNNAHTNNASHMAARACKQNTQWQRRPYIQDMLTHLHTFQHIEIGCTCTCYLSSQHAHAYTPTHQDTHVLEIHMHNAKNYIWHMHRLM